VMGGEMNYYSTTPLSLIHVFETGWVSSFQGLAIEKATIRGMSPFFGKVVTNLKPFLSSTFMEIFRLPVLDWERGELFSIVSVCASVNHVTDIISIRL